MNYSLRSTFIAITWVAWLVAALTVQHGLVPELFVLSQFGMLAVAISLLLCGPAQLRPFGICFAAGFLAWFLLLTGENWFCDTQLFRSTPAGSRLWQLAGALVDEKSDSLGSRMNTTTSVLRSAVGSFLGTITYVCLLLIKPAEWNADDGEA